MNNDTKDGLILEHKDTKIHIPSSKSWSMKWLIFCFGAYLLLAGAAKVLEIVATFA